MSFSVDQFMQVKCKLQLTSESESSESIHTNCEQIRLCASAELDRNATLIVLVCSNETSNNNILAYYIERRQTAATYARSPSTSPQLQAQELSRALKVAEIASQSSAKATRATGRPRPKIVVKQIYYHNYNEDIVSLCLSETGNKLILISASSSIYILPIKNILLNLHAQQLRSSQGRSMYFYDATILSNLKSIDDPVSIVCWDSANTPGKSYIIVACRDGNRLVFIDANERKEICSTSVSEPIRGIEIIRDRFSFSLLITCQSFNQYRQTLELLQQDAESDQTAQSSSRPSIISLPKATGPSTSSGSSKTSGRHLGAIEDEAVLNARDFTPSWSSKPLPIKLNSTASGVVASNAIHRVFTPSASRFGSHASLPSSAANFGEARDRPLSILFNQQPNLIGLVDILGANQTQHQQASHLRRPGQSAVGHEPRLLRFYSNKQYFYRSQRPQVICKLNNLEPDELITHLLLTERFIAFATNRDRCIINSRNCCKLKNPSPHAPIELEPLIKEVAFNSEEKILTLIKSPVTHDQDNILDSFLLVTTRSIYSIDARHNCRDLFINLIDSHLAIKRTLFTPRTHSKSFDEGRTLTAPTNQLQLPNDPNKSRSAESNLLISDFLQHREVYESICHDSLAFSTLFKLELSSLYEAYADRLLQRQQFELANRFFHMASFDHAKILGKYIRLGAYKETIDYVKSILSDENDFRKILSESERLELAKIAFECLLSKLIVERSKLLVYRTKLTRTSVEKLLTRRQQQLKSPNKAVATLAASAGLRAGRSFVATSMPNKFEVFRLCEHSPKGQDAKLSTATIVGDLHEDDEATLTSNTDADDSSQKQQISRRHLKNRCRLECERALIDFIRNLMPSSLYGYAVDRLLDFDLVELVEPIAQTDVQILALIKALIRSRDEGERLLFRTGKFDLLTDKLERLNKIDLIKIDTGKLEFLEFITSKAVTRALVKNISLTCDFYRYQHTLVQFRKYSFAALRHLETYKLLVEQLNGRESASHSSTHLKPSNAFGGLDSETLGGVLDDDNANDGLALACTKRDDGCKLFTEQQKQTAEDIFIQFLSACLEESAEDSCRLWFNYINFYLNYIGNLQSLQVDILKLVESSGDCRLAISLYKAIYREETTKGRNGFSIGQRAMVNSSNGTASNSHKNNNDNNNIGLNHSDSAQGRTTARKLDTMSSFLKANLIDNTPLEAMEELHNLANLFANEFLMRLLEKTLDLLPQSADLDALIGTTIATMC